jgi:ribose 1,5-bisphosphokinase
MSKLFYVIGASGAGKDTLMNYARAKINGNERVIFAHRYITREPGNGNENHVYLSPEEFKLRANAGCFALYWESHGKHYGIGSEIDQWLGMNFNVVVNGSREYLTVARQLYPAIIVILVTASPEVISERLAGRGRESADEIEKRIKRTDEINCDLTDCIQIQNDASIENAGDELVNIVILSKLESIISK